VCKLTHFAGHKNNTFRRIRTNLATNNEESPNSRSTLPPSGTGERFNKTLTYPFRNTWPVIFSTKAIEHNPRLFILCLHDYSATRFLATCAFMWMAGVKAGMSGVKTAATK
jgi:hypothetical protein